MYLCVYCRIHKSCIGVIMHLGLNYKIKSANIEGETSIKSNNNSLWCEVESAAKFSPTPRPAEVDNRQYLATQRAVNNGLHIPSRAITPASISPETNQATLESISKPAASLHQALG